VELQGIERLMWTAVAVVASKSAAGREHAPKMMSEGQEKEVVPKRPSGSLGHILNKKGSLVDHSRICHRKEASL